MATMTVEGRIQIGRVRGGGEDEIWIELIDHKAGAHFAVARLSLEDFARAVTAQEVSCQIEIRSVERLGKVQEVKTVCIAGVPYVVRDAWRSTMLNAVAAYEVDGWQHDEGDLHRYNGHRVKGDGYEVMFRRWVDRSKEDQEGDGDPD